jgi:hypothetical protein
VGHLQERFGTSERRACRVVGQPRSTQRRQPQRSEADRALVERMKKLARKHPRYGYRRIHALLVREGWRVNRKRVHRLWREENLKIRRRPRKRRRLGGSENGCTRKRAERKGHVWSYDFTLDQTEDGKRLKLMPVVDEFTRECHAIEVARSLTARDVISTLSYLFQVHGEPAYIRSDNGPEFFACGSARIHRHRGEGVVGRLRGADALRRAGQSVAERLCGVVQRKVGGRAARAGTLHEPDRGEGAYPSSTGWSTTTSARTARSAIRPRQSSPAPAMWSAWPPRLAPLWPSATPQRGR